MGLGTGAVDDGTQGHDTRSVAVDAVLGGDDCFATETLVVQATVPCELLPEPGTEAVTAVVEPAVVESEPMDLPSPPVDMSNAAAAGEVAVSELLAAPAFERGSPVGAAAVDFDQTDSMVPEVAPRIDVPVAVASESEFPSAETHAAPDLHLFDSFDGPAADPVESVLRMFVSPVVSGSAEVDASLFAEKIDACGAAGPVDTVRYEDDFTSDVERADFDLLSTAPGPADSATSEALALSPAHSEAYSPELHDVSSLTAASDEAMTVAGDAAQLPNDHHDDVPVSGTVEGCDDAAHAMKHKEHSAAPLQPEARVELGHTSPAADPIPGDCIVQQTPTAPGSPFLPAALILPSPDRASLEQQASEAAMSGDDCQLMAAETDAPSQRDRDVVSDTDFSSSDLNLTVGRLTVGTAASPLAGPGLFGIADGDEDDAQSDKLSVISRGSDLRFEHEETE
jgi:hypothetical protein